jgi:hypothetical protein
MEARKTLLDVNTGNTTRYMGLVLSLVIALFTEYQFARPNSTVHGSFNSVFLEHHFFTLMILGTGAATLYSLVMAAYWGNLTRLLVQTDLVKTVIPSLQMGEDDLVRLSAWFDRKVLEGHFGWMQASHRGLMWLLSSLVFLTEIVAIMITWNVTWAWYSIPFVCLVVTGLGISFYYAYHYWDQDWVAKRPDKATSGTTARGA